MLSFGNEMMWRHRARDFDAVIEYYIKRPNDRSGLISKKNRLAFTCNSLTKGVSLHYIKYVT